jgi:hypothetical protein
MTPRQLQAYERLRHWRQEEELANLAETIRAAQNLDKDGFTNFIKRLRG